MENKGNSREYKAVSLKRIASLSFSSFLLVESLLVPNAFGGTDGKVFKKQTSNSIKVDGMGKSDSMTFKQIEVKRQSRIQSMNQVLDQVDQYANSFGIKLDYDRNTYANRGYVALANEVQTKQTLTAAPFYELSGSELKGLIDYAYSKLSEAEKKKVDSLREKYILGKDGIQNSVNNLRKQLSERQDKTSTIMGPAFSNGPYGHEEQQLVIAANVAISLALERREDELRQLSDALNGGSSYNLRDIGLSINEFYIHFDRNKLLSGLLESAIYDEKGKAKLSEIEIHALKRVNWGSFKEGDSLLYQNNDKTILHPNGYQDGFIPGIQTEKDVHRELKRIIQSGRISSSFDAGLNFHRYVANPEIGMQYEAVKIYSHNLILNQIADQAPKYAKHPEVLRHFPTLALIFQHEVYKTLIKSVSISENKVEAAKQIQRAKAISEMFYHLVPLIIEKGDTIRAHGQNREKYEDNKADYYSFTPYLVRGVFEIMMDGKEIVQGVPNLGAYRLFFSPSKGNPLNDYISGKKEFPTKPEEIKKLAVKIISAIDGDCAVQQIRIDAVQLRVDKKTNSVKPSIVLSPTRAIHDRDANKSAEILVAPESTKFSTPMLAGLIGKWSSTNKLNEKEQRILGIEFDRVGKVVNKPALSNISYPPSQTGVNWSTVFFTKGKYFKPHKFETKAIEIPAPESIPISIPYFLRMDIKTGGGIGGVPTGFSTRFNSTIDGLVRQAWSLQQEAESNPKGLIQVNKLLYSAVQKAYDLDPAAVGGNATKVWLNANENAAKNGIFETPLPAELLNSQFGSELSLVNVPNQLKLDETRTVNAFDFYIKKDLYLKTGWVQYDTKSVVGSVKGYDSNGDPVFGYAVVEDSDKKVIGGLGYHIKSEGENKVKLEVFGASKDLTVKTMSEEDKTMLQKFGKHVLREWEGSGFKVAGKKMLELVNLFDEVSITRYGDRWLMQARTNNLSMPLTVPLSWIGLRGVPANVNWRSVFSADATEGSFRTSLSKDFGNILELNVKTGKYSWALWEYFNGPVLSPKAIGTELRIKKNSFDLGVGFSLVPKPGEITLNSKNIFKNNIPSGHLSIKF